ncbi:permease prefix domain 1-containing protein [Micromonospora sp. NPDC006766]|uniref:permease prefix domain 1-containing protein n=1 Tax=Micromonospora sp. NPDC006766 TaxID=3154778 RepID=UPI0033EEF384
MIIPNETAGGHGIYVHRLLDEAFTGIEMTPERQDLKEEIRANLVARVAELTATGVAPQAAARQAVEELGAVRGILDGTAPEPEDAAPDWLAHRVRPNPMFLVRAVVLSALVTAGLVVLVLAATLLDVPFSGQVAAVAAVVLAAGAVTADALRQETTSNHPMPTGRALGYGLGVVLASAGLGAGWLYLHERGVPWLVGGALTVVASAALFTYLGGTQTNRHKEWVVRLQATHAQVGDRFTKDPAAAARFGMYAGTTWLLVLAAFVMLTLTVGWAWSWLAVVAGLVATMLMLARMLFAPQPALGGGGRQPAGSPSR